MSMPHHDPLVCGIDPHGVEVCPGCVAAAATAAAAECAEAAAYWQQREIDRVVGEIADLLGRSADDTRALVPRLRQAMLHGGGKL